MYLRNEYIRHRKPANVVACDCCQLTFVAVCVTDHDDGDINNDDYTNEYIVACRYLIPIYYNNNM